MATRRGLLNAFGVGALFAALLTAAALAMPAHAQAPSWPSKTVRVVMPYPPGSPGDVLLRTMLERLSVQWGQPAVVENRPGANTLIGAEAVARSAADGHTLLFTTDSTITTNPHIYAKLPYDPIKDFAPITMVASFEMMLFASPSLPADTGLELIALARAQPGRITYGSLGDGSQHHIVSSLLGTAAGISLVQVPYKGVPQVTTAVLAGEVHFTWGGGAFFKGHVEAKRLKALGVAGPRRSELLPDVPTFAELGLPTIDFTLWWGLFAPAGTPRSVAERIHSDFARLLADPMFVENDVRPKGYRAGGIGLDAFAAHIQRELPIRAEMVKLSGARPQ